ncbi:MAG: YcxB family protein [Luteibacter sp.]
MQDTLVIRTDRTLPWLRRSLFGMYRWVSTGLIILVVMGFLLLLYVTDPGPSVVLNCVPFVVFVGIIVAWLIPRHFKLAQKMFDEAQLSGPPVFTATRDRIRCDCAGNTTDLKWSSVHSVCVSSKTLYVFVNRRSAWFLPRGESEDRLINMARDAGVRIRGG